VARKRGEPAKIPRGDKFLAAGMHYYGMLAVVDPSELSEPTKVRLRQVGLDLEAAERCKRAARRDG
jgi:hypothetical protein